MPKPRFCAYDHCHEIEVRTHNAAYCIPCNCKRKRENSVRRAQKTIHDVYDEELYQLEERRKEAQGERNRHKNEWILNNKTFATFDLETTQLDADFGRILCGCIKPLEGDVVTYAAPKTDERIVEQIRRELAKYDYIITWYGTGFDIPFMRTRLLVHGLPQLAPMRHVDLYYTSRHNFKFASNRQAMVTLSTTGKASRTPVVGRTWDAASVGSKEALNTIVEHCVADLDDLETLFFKLSPFRNLSATRIV